MGALKIIQPISSHVVDILGSTRGRDQPIMLMEKALLLVEQIGEEAFTDPNTVFFDPFCKAGEILLATAIKLCLIKNKKNITISSIQEISDDIYLSNRFFALAPDERHYLLSLRTFYGNEKSHDPKFTCFIKNGNYLSETDGNLQPKKFEKEFKSMIEFIKKAKPDSKIIAIGNPPYQEADGGGNGSSAKPIYNIFAESLISNSSIYQFILVIPSRWFVGGKGLDDFRKGLMTSRKIQSITHFDKSGDVFPTVDIDGGVCFLNYNKNHSGLTEFKAADQSINLNLEEFDVIPDDPKSISILEKIKNRWSGHMISNVAKPRNYFSISAETVAAGKPEAFNDSIECLSRNRTTIYINQKSVLKNHADIGLWKVCIPKAYGGQRGDRRMTMPSRHFFLINPKVIPSETYSVVQFFKTKTEAEKFIKYLQTDFCRYLLGLRKNTQNVSRETWGWIPLLEMTQEWTNEALYTYFRLNKEEQDHIKKKVQEWS